MNFTSIAVGLYVAFVIIFLYCYWGSVYRSSRSRIGMLAASKYRKELPPGSDPRPASVVKNGNTAVVKFNIYAGDPMVPVDGATRAYTIVRDSDQCESASKIVRKADAECQGLLSDEMNKKCFYQVATGLNCIWI